MRRRTRRCRPPPGRRRRRDGGQAAVELALCLPFVVTALLLVVQVGLVVRAQVLVANAAREAARAAAVGATAPAAAGLDPDATTVAVAVGGPGAQAWVTATVIHHLRTDVPLVGALVPDVELTATATMRLEGGAGSPP